jgi:hypothetical protein
MQRRAPTRTIHYELPEGLSQEGVSALMQKIVEKVNAKQDIYLALSSSFL